MQRTISQRQIAPLLKMQLSNSVVEDAVDLFLQELRYVAESTRPDVLICAPPSDLRDALKDRPNRQVLDQNGSSFARQFDFHDLLKAKAMALRVPVQLIWPQTYDSSVRVRQRRRPNRDRKLQDEATRAWNLHTALYYKSGGTPVTSLDFCKLGVAGAWREWPPASTIAAD